MSKRSDILASIKTTLENITVANGFNATVASVKRGIRVREDFAGNFPSLALWNESVPIIEDAFGIFQKTLLLHVFGYVNVDAYKDDYSALDNLIADVEKALMVSTWNSYYDRTKILSIDVLEGGEEDSFGLFDFQVEIQTEYTTGSI